MSRVTHGFDKIVNDYKGIEVYHKVNELIFNPFIDFDLKCRMGGQKCKSKITEEVILFFQNPADPKVQFDAFPATIQL